MTGSTPRILVLLLSLSLSLPAPSASLWLAPGRPPAALTLGPTGLAFPRFARRAAPLGCLKGELLRHPTFGLRDLQPSQSGVEEKLSKRLRSPAAGLEEAVAEGRPLMGDRGEKQDQSKLRQEDQEGRFSGRGVPGAVVGYPGRSAGPLQLGIGQTPHKPAIFPSQHPPSRFQPPDGQDRPQVEEKPGYKDLRSKWTPHERPDYQGGEDDRSEIRRQPNQVLPSLGGQPRLSTHPEQKLTTSLPMEQGNLWSGSGSFPHPTAGLEEGKERIVRFLKMRIGAEVDEGTLDQLMTNPRAENISSLLNPYIAQLPERQKGKVTRQLPGLIRRLQDEIGWVNRKAEELEAATRASREMAIRQLKRRLFNLDPPSERHAMAQQARQLISMFREVPYVSWSEMPQAVDQLFDRMDLKPGQRLLEIGPGSDGGVGLIGALKGLQVVVVEFDRPFPVDVGRLRSQFELLGPQQARWLDPLVAAQRPVTLNMLEKLKKAVAPYRRLIERAGGSLIVIPGDFSDAEVQKRVKNLGLFDHVVATDVIDPTGGKDALTLDVATTSEDLKVEAILRGLAETASQARSLYVSFIVPEESSDRLGIRRPIQRLEGLLQAQGLLTSEYDRVPSPLSGGILRARLYRFAKNPSAPPGQKGQASEGTPAGLEEEAERMLRILWEDDFDRLMKGVVSLEKIEALSQVNSLLLREELSASSSSTEWEENFMAALMSNLGSASRTIQRLTSKTLEELAFRGLTPQAVLGLPRDRLESFVQKAFFLIWERLQTPALYEKLSFRAKTILLKNTLESLQKSVSSDGSGFETLGTPHQEAIKILQRSIFAVDRGSAEEAELLQLFEAIDPGEAGKIRVALEAQSSTAGLEEVSEEFLAYERTLAERINREEVFRVELQEGGLIRRLALAHGEVLYDSQQRLGSPDSPLKMTLGQVLRPILLAYAPDSGLLALNVNFQQLIHFSPEGGPTYLEPKGLKTEAEPQFRDFMDMLEKAGGATRIDFPRHGRERSELLPSEPILENEVRIELANSQGIARIILAPSGNWIVSLLPAGLEEQFRAMGREVWEAAGLMIIAGVAESLPRGFVMTEEAVTGDFDRPGIGLYLRLLFKEDPGLPIRVVAHNAESRARISRGLGILLDQVKSPGEGESYEEAILRAAGDFRPERKVILVDIRRREGIPTLVLPVEPEMWLWRLTQLFRLLGVHVPRGLSVSFYAAGLEAARALAEKV